jgi:hypothetical protein
LEAVFGMVCKGESCVFGFGGVIAETLARSLGAVLVAIAAVPAVLACMLRATELCWLDGAR